MNRRSAFLRFLLLSPSLRLSSWAKFGGDSLFSFQHENVLGTSLDLRVRAENEASARAAEQAVLAEVDRLARVLSLYSSTSEISQWRARPSLFTELSPDLFAVLSACDDWEKRSGGVFNPRSEALARLWATAVKRQEIPDSETLADTRRRMQEPAWELNAAEQTGRSVSDCPISLNSLAKGYIIESAGRVGYSATGVEGLLLNIGGDLRAWGDMAETVAIADPRADAENARAISQISLRSQALATSGDYRRGFAIGEERYSHLFDPRTGYPVREIISASVVARDATTADVLATIFSILTPEESLAMANDMTDVECLLITSKGETKRSAGWADKPVRVQSPGSANAWHEEFELLVKFEINRPDGGRYQRPYVAVWVEDKDGFPVRTLSLWLLQSQKGRKWLPDLKRWSKSDRMRGLVDATDLASTISAATRQPGQYSVTWDGLDDAKKPAKAGEYTLYIEAAREHGTYQLIQQKIAVGGATSKTDLKGNIEIKSASVEYRRKDAAR